MCSNTTSIAEYPNGCATAVMINTAEYLLRTIFISPFIMYFFNFIPVLFASTALATVNTTYTAIDSSAPMIVTTTTFITLVSVSPALPTNTVTTFPDGSLAGVYICSDINWGGTCEHKFTSLGGSDSDCTLLTGQESSIGPDAGFFCEFYTNAYCRKLLDDESDYLGLAWPGIADLRDTAKGDYNDRLFSYACFPGRFMGNDGLGRRREIE
ncbi:hypothetical protein GMOD_00003273 [Pyrenophora seminiperda CCB06]|uniref:Uncharacterized protein n=1 Tax=Pyrenophora seminiperda CCB06 TaxID=1302712 RepID=A0A3M7MIB8_9PLEO|nr:hypothetical protein GMOD_00003273 [Pyrenophora seminiperda CCB06]